jgi:phosphomannomutase
MIDPSIFRTYNIRGIYPSQLNEEVTRKIAHGFLSVVKPKSIVVGRDVRLSSPALHDAFVDAVTETGLDVTDLGVANTDRQYFAAGHYGFDLGVVISASHNPAEWNGLKGSKKDVEPMSGEEVKHVKEFVLAGKALPKAQKRGQVKKMETMADYLNHVLSFVDEKSLRPMRILANCNFGTMGEVIRALQKRIPFDLVPLNIEPDGSFPKGPPDPLLPKMRVEVTEEARKMKPDFCVAWDNDGDRCYFHDEHGDFIPGAFTTATLARLILEKKSGGKVVSEPRIVWPVQDSVEQAGGEFVLYRTGYVFIREKMREIKAVFGGENSGHYFFPENWYADNGFIPFLMIWEHLSKTGEKLSEVVGPLREKYFVSEEMNYPLPSPEQGKAIQKEAERHYKDGKIEYIDGLHVSFSDWRFTLRASHNEPLLRLQLESKDQKLLDARTGELTEFVKKLT